jgi:hypothetical protein
MPPCTSAPRMEGVRKRHCWECMRRCLVCDSMEPACQRCCTSGTVCPGYSNVKPTRLKWLSPGKVRSRPRRLKLPPLDKRGNDQHKSKAGTPATLVVGRQVIPRLDLDPEASILLQAAEYCKSLPNDASTMSRLTVMTQLTPASTKI